MHPKKFSCGIFLSICLVAGTTQAQSLNEQLFTAIAAGDQPKVEALLGKHADLNGRNQYGQTPLISAVFNGKKEIVELLIAHGADLNAKGAGTTVLGAAACGPNKKSILELLLAHGAGVNEKDEYGNSALDRAAGCAYDDDRLAMAEFLVAKGADVNAKGQLGHTPLESATEGGRLDLMQLLIAHGADLNAMGASPGFFNIKTDPPLAIAAFESQKKAVELLLAKGADVNVKDDKGETPLQVMEHIPKGRLCLLPNYSTDKDCAITNKEIVALLHAASGKNMNPGDLLKNYLAQFKGHSGDDTVRQSILELTLKMKPAPAVPPEAEAAAGRGAYIFKTAKSQDDVLNAAKEYLAAVELAPWVANYYFNLCTILEKTPYTQQALHACKFYLLAAPNAMDAGEMRQRIAGLQYAVDTNKARMLQRTAYIKSRGAEDLYRFGGISGMVSGHDIALKLFVDWEASPPRYQVGIRCFANGGVYGINYELTSLDTGIQVCAPAVNMHLIIHPEGAGSVALSDTNSGTLRASLDDLFQAKQKTMAEAVMFSAGS
ncbi:MAG TPA: ankyrin repeat domain-containing protein, partial [Acidobacteriaceae bacterium]